MNRSKAYLRFSYAVCVGLVSGDEKKLLCVFFSTEGEDFNKMSETDYEQRKKKMEEQFVSQNLKPGDDGFVYDKQIEFPEPQMESGWDSNQEDSDLEF